MVNTLLTIGLIVVSAICMLVGTLSFASAIFITWDDDFDPTILVLIMFGAACLLVDFFVSWQLSGIQNGNTFTPGSTVFGVMMCLKWASLALIGGIAGKTRALAKR